MAAERVPRLIRLMLAHAAIGFGISTLFVLALLWSDLGGLSTLMQRSDLWPGPALLLWFFSGLTFASVQMGAAIILIGSGREDGTGGGHRQRRRAAGPEPVPVPVRTRR